MAISDHYPGQRQVLINAINAFESALIKLHGAYRRNTFADWPTIVLSTTLQTSAISLFKLLPQSASREPLDKRSIASIVRNIIDTHDVLEFVVGAATAEQFNLHRDILGLYLANRIAKIQNKIDATRARELYPRAAGQYWRRIRSSRLYTRSMGRLKNGESIFYESRAQRVSKACGSNAEFVMGVLADLSTYVHSMPPGLWFDELNELYANKPRNRSVISVWLRITNFYLGRCFVLVQKVFPAAESTELSQFIADHTEVFAR